MKKLICLLALGGAAFGETPTAIVVRDARVVTVSGSTLERGTVLVRDGLIEAVGDNVQIPPEAWVIEGKGLTVYPGPIDALSVLAPPAAPAARPTTPPSTPPAPIRGPQDRPQTTSWLRAADLVTASDRRIEELRNAGFTNAVVFPGSGIFAGQGAVVNLAGEKPRMVVASPAGQYGTLTFRGGGFPASLMGVMAYIRQVSIDAAYYQQQKQAYDRRQPGVPRPDYDRALEGVLESPRLLLPAQTDVELERMVRFAPDLKSKIVMYGGAAGYQMPGALAASGIPVLVSLKWPEQPRDADPDAPVSLRALELQDQAPSTPAALAKAGARFAFYTDGTAPRDLPRAVKRAMDAGLTEAEMVKAFTLSAAEVYGVSDRLGSIEKGKIANLVVTEGPLFGEKSKVKFLFIDGVKMEPVPEAPRTGGVE
jgi:imidazolonepropionase-like amidohydrolase